jgi:hypothetical protein
LDTPFLNFDLIALADTEAIAERCEGQNARKTLVIFQAAENPEVLRSFLGKVLAAVQLDLTNDVLALTVTPDEKFSFSGLCQLFDIQSLILFGIKPENLGIHFQFTPYDLLRYEGRAYLFVDDLQLIYEERQQGGKRMSGELWKVLKTLFLK